MSWRAWHEVWWHALYGHDGFYRRPEGPAGHFATSAQGIPHGAAVMAQVMSALMDRYALTTFVDFGCGRGELASAVRTVRPDAQVVAVDVVDRPAGLDDAIRWLRSPGGGATLPDELDGVRDALVIAHEWLDVVPCPVAALDDRDELRVVEVDERGNERLGAPVVGADLDWAHTYWPTPPARSLDIGTTRDRAYEQLCSRVDKGVVVAIDYGHLADERPCDSTLVGYREGRMVEPDPTGSTDLTAHVAVDSLAVGHPATTLARQYEMLGTHRPPSAPRDLAHERPAAYLDALATSGAWRALSEPGGLGDFWWVQTVK